MKDYPGLTWLAHYRERVNEAIVTPAWADQSVATVPTGPEYCRLGMRRE
jgi:hypothetical protein